MNYAADVSCKDCWEGLKNDTASQLVDVRTMAEWSFVGTAELGELSKKPILAEWQSFPSMDVNLSFCEQVVTALGQKNLGKDTHLYFICRSGVRSRSSAIAMTAKGYANSFNVVGGFEGDPDESRRRGHRNGWKHDDLPWGQS